MSYHLCCCLAILEFSLSLRIGHFILSPVARLSWLKFSWIEILGRISQLFYFTHCDSCRCCLYRHSARHQTNLPHKYNKLLDKWHFVVVFDKNDALLMEWIVNRSWMEMTINTGRRICFKVYNSERRRRLSKWEPSLVYKLFLNLTPPFTDLSSNKIRKVDVKTRCCCQRITITWMTMISCTYFQNYVIASQKLWVGSDTANVRLFIVSRLE